MNKTLLTAFFLLFLITKSNAQEAFIGEIKMFAGNFATRGWALCDGQLLPINQNQALFSILGTAYGGDGETTFALPDLRGRVPVHAGQAPGLTSYRLGERGGQESVTLTVPNLPAHNHTINANSTLGDSNDPTGNLPAQTGLFDNEYSTQSANAQLSSSTVNNTGNGSPVQIRQPYNTVHFIIALQGVYPSPN